MIMVDTPSLEDIPTTLADIVRRNRHLFEIGPATAPEVAAVTGDVDTIGAPRDRIDSWHLIAFRHVSEGIATLHVLGRVRPWTARITSDVAVLAADRSRVRTRNSLYALGSPAEGEPDLPLLLLVVRVLRHWGLDQRYDLDVIPVFY